MEARKWLSELRNAQGLSQTKVAEMSGIDRSSYAMVELGKRNPSARTAQKIAKALGFNWVIFFGSIAFDSQHNDFNNIP